jgi:hypothetical protein
MLFGYYMYHFYGFFFQICPCLSFNSSGLKYKTKVEIWTEYIWLFFLYFRHKGVAFLLPGKLILKFSNIILSNLQEENLELLDGEGL